MSVYTNPAYYSGPTLELVTMRAKDSQTWQPGQFARSTATGVVKCTAVTAKVGCQFLTASNQPTATSSSDVKLYKIPSAQTKFLIYVTKASADAVANKMYIGQNVGIAVNSCIVTAAPINTTYAALHVEQILPNIGAGRSENDTSTSPGRFVVSVIQTCLDGDAG